MIFLLRDVEKNYSRTIFVSSESHSLPGFVFSGVLPNGVFIPGSFMIYREKSVSRSGLCFRNKTTSGCYLFRSFDIS